MNDELNSTNHRAQTTVLLRGNDGNDELDSTNDRARSDQSVKCTSSDRPHRSLPRLALMWVTNWSFTCAPTYGLAEGILKDYPNPNMSPHRRASSY
jgi:hypothetical protein